MTIKKSPQTFQREHWERKDQIGYSIGLIKYMLTKPMPAPVRVNLTAALNDLKLAYINESQNNEFINLKKKPAWRIK